MIRRLAFAFLFAAAALAADAGRSPASAGLLDAVGTGPSAVPECGDGAVIEAIRDRFLHADANVLKRGLYIRTVDHVRQSHFGSPAGPTLRRYCHASAVLNDGPRPKTLYYLIEQNYGFAGIGWNVEFCVQGYEPWRVHDGNCRTVRKWW